MKLIFLKRETIGGRKQVPQGSYNIGGAVQLNKACGELFDLENNFKYCRVAIPELKEREFLKTFYLVEETDQETIERDANIIKIHKDNKSGQLRFNFAELLKHFEYIFAADSKLKTIRFKADRKEIEGFKVIELTVNNN